MQQKNQKPRHRVKYSDAYISYVNNGHSAAVFIARDIADAVPTKGMWIDVLNTEGSHNTQGRWDFDSITVELFPRKTRPHYPRHASKKDCDYITWQVATHDIALQRKARYKGKKYQLKLRLVDANYGKTKTVEKVWNPRAGRWIPKGNPYPDYCEIKIKQEPLPPKWEYQILSVKELKK